VLRGCLQAYTYFEDNPFVLDFITHGGIINSNLVLLEDSMKVYLKAVVQTNILTLHKDVLSLLKYDEKNLHKKVLMA
jgi:hypothetical protein